MLKMPVLKNISSSGHFINGHFQHPLNQSHPFFYDGIIDLVHKIWRWKFPCEISIAIFCEPGQLFHHKKRDVTG
jgi:hypothetical protein